MKLLIVAVVAVSPFFLSMAGCDICDTGITVRNNSHDNGNSGNNDSTGKQMKITVGSAVFTATLYANATAASFKAMLPLTLSMSDLNSNEKYYYFSGTLPVNITDIGTIKAGDLMLYGNNCLVLFYKSFSTSYSYTRLGHINNISGLVAALGNDNITVRFELQ